ncbi:MAG TPA: hypothetical protein VD902_15185 [Symbiobacteriaceae bacterium]|nr:hypothetical protein [Symbiobacteriaceae bacterium]
MVFVLLVTLLAAGCRAASKPVPTLDFTLEQEGEGLVVRVQVTGMQVPEQGHVHVYLDDGPEAMAYTTTYRIPKVAPGAHKVRVELSDMQHRPLGVSLTKEITIK